MGQSSEKTGVRDNWDKRSDRKRKALRQTETRTDVATGRLCRGSNDHNTEQRRSCRIMSPSPIRGFLYLMFSFHMFLFPLPRLYVISCVIFSHLPSPGLHLLFCRYYGWFFEVQGMVSNIILTYILPLYLASCFSLVLGVFWSVKNG